MDGERVRGNEGGRERLDGRKEERHYEAPQ